MRQQDFSKSITPPGFYFLYQVRFPISVTNPKIKFLQVHSSNINYLLKGTPFRHHFREITRYIMLNSTERRLIPNSCCISTSIPIS